MAQDQKLTNKKLNEIWNNSKVKTLTTKNRKYVIFSDLHLGDGGEADDFHINEQIFRIALKYYNKEDFILLLLGDIEELWQFDLETIVKKYDKTVYKDIRALGTGKTIRIFGNHDQEFGGIVDPISYNLKRSGSALEALKLKDVNGHIKILLVHGHQGSLESDKNSWFSRFFVRSFKVVEPIAKFFGLYGEGAAAKSMIPSDYEKIIYSWAKRKKVLIICGHSHRAIFASKSFADRLQDKIYDLQIKIQNAKGDSNKIANYLKEIYDINKEISYEESKGRSIDPTEKNKSPKPCYFNTGCGLYNDGMTSIEIENDEIRLVKWNKEPKNTQYREIYHKGEISKFLDEFA